MPIRNHIVVGYDFSVGSRRALDSAIAIARRTDSDIAIVHSLPSLPAGLAGAPRRSLAMAALAARKEAKAGLSSIAEALARRGCIVDQAVHDGPAADALLQEAEARDASLIVVGSAGKGFLDQALLGSTAQDVVTRTTRPVLVVPRSQVPTGKRRGPIVVGLAADASDRTVLEETRRWAEQLQATVAVVHAIILPGFASRNLPDGRGGYSNIMAEERKRLAESLPELGRTTKVHVELGSAAHLLQLHARQANARMIVVGKRAKRARWGTVLGDLTQSADRPLLVVPFTVTKSTPREEHA